MGSSPRASPTPRGLFDEERDKGRSESGRSPLIPQAIIRAIIGSGCSGQLAQPRPGCAASGTHRPEHPLSRTPPAWAPPDTPSPGTPSLGHPPSQSPPVPGTAFPGHPLSGAPPSPGIHHPGTPCPGTPTPGTPGPCQVTLLPRHHGRDTAPALEVPEQPTMFHQHPRTSSSRGVPNTGSFGEPRCQLCPVSQTVPTRCPRSPGWHRWQRDWDFVSHQIPCPARRARQG